MNRDYALLREDDLRIIPPAVDSMQPSFWRRSTHGRTHGLAVSLLYRAIQQTLWQSEEGSIIVLNRLVFNVADQDMTARRISPEQVLGMRLEIETGREPDDHKARFSLAMRPISAIAAPCAAAVFDLNGSRIVSWPVQ